MTKTRYIRAQQRLRCGKCGAPTCWGEVCVMCGAAYTRGEAEQRELPTSWRYYDVAMPEKLRVGHGSICTAEGEPHKCHCGGGVTHPCNCYES